MNHFRLYAPDISRRAVRFRWSVEPRSSLYRAHSFTLRFPEAVPLERVPAALWWTIALICLHSHWTVLRPCEVELPVTLPPGETEFWRRLLQAEVTTLEALRGGSDATLGIEMIQTGPPLSPPIRIPDSSRCATAFSGGKDSLLQAGLLTELTDDPILVTTTSPMPPLQDHSTSRRRRILDQIPRRRKLALVEVETAFRATWDNHFADRQGYPIAINEISDTFVYLGSLVAASAALGATHLFLASEAEVQASILRDGKIVQHSHFMYSVATQRALQALLARYGFRYSSLTSPLHSGQVQRLLWSRYPDLSDLQYSCWRVREPDQTCSECGQCLRIAMTALAMGQNPETMGINLIRLFRTNADWSLPDSPPEEDPLPTKRVARRFHTQTARLIRETSTRRVARAILQSGPTRALSAESRAALRAYRRLRRRFIASPAAGPNSYRAGFLRHIDPLLRDQIAAIYASSFPAESQTDDDGDPARTDALARWITEPLGGEA